MDVLGKKLLQNAVNLYLFSMYSKFST